MSPKEPETGYQPPAEELPDIYPSKTFSGAWYCRLCSTHFNADNVAAHRARHERDRAIAAADEAILAQARELFDYELAAIDITMTHRLELLVKAIRARQALDRTIQGPQDNAESAQAPHGHQGGVRPLEP